MVRSHVSSLVRSLPKECFPCLESQPLGATQPTNIPMLVVASAEMSSRISAYGIPNACHQMVNEGDECYELCNTDQDQRSFRPQLNSTTRGRGGGGWRVWRREKVGICDLGPT